MSKKLNEALSKELGRFHQIVSYQDNLIKEGQYYFHQQLPEADGEEIDPTLDPMAEPEQGEPSEPVGIDPNNPNGEVGVPNEPLDTGGDMGDENPEAGMDEPMGDDELNMDDTDGLDPSMDGGDDLGGDTTEVDVTELVTGTNELKMKVEDVLTKVGQSTQQFSNLMSKVDAIQSNLTKMDSLVNKMQDLAKQVELMRPPTETERRKAVAKDSYPFSVTMDDYSNGVGDKTQTDMEKNPRMSMLNTIMSDYNDSKVKDSFYSPQDNPFKNM
jgi:hypothetical protein